MKFKRKLELTFYRLFHIITFHKYYICDNCHKIHKKTGDEMEICGGGHFVSIDCLMRTINRAASVLQEWRN